MARLSKLTGREKELIRERKRPAKELYRPTVEVPHRDGADQHRQYKSKGLTIIRVKVLTPWLWRGIPHD